MASCCGECAGEDTVPLPQNRPMPERWLPVDEDGWTVVGPAADSRLFYVSASDGDDQTAGVYAPGDSSIGIRRQCKAHWRAEFTAPVINDWIRAGLH